MVVDMTRLPFRGPLVALAYVALSLAVTGIWVHFARTEALADEMVVATPSGRYTARFGSIIGSAEGRVFSPFVKRRLLPDAARGLAALVPDSFWSPLRRRMEDPAAPGWLRAVLARQGWKARDCPLLCCAYFLVWLSVLGFMATCRHLARLLYEGPPWVADLAGAALGVALLGGNGDWHYCGYPYDFPNAFVFALTLAGMLARRWWFPLAFAAAAYSKETSLLLIAAHLLLARHLRSPRPWAVAGLLGAIFVSARLWINAHYHAPEPEAGFWFPLRNARFLGYPLFYGWLTPFFVVGLVRIWSLREHYPRALKRLCLLAVPMVAMAFFKGWLEELRQYLELLPVFGLILFQWCLHEAGLGHVLRAGSPDIPGRQDRPAVAGSRLHDGPQRWVGSAANGGPKASQPPEDVLPRSA
jgi:hypothetical protein